MKRNSNGFTLVETLVAIAIIATLAALVFPVMQALRTRGQAIQSTANLRSLAAANMTYLAEHGMFCPADDQFNNRRWHGARSSSEGKFDPAKGFLAPYLGASREVGLCPLLKSLVADEQSYEAGTGGYGYNDTYIGGRPGGNYDKLTKLRIPERLANISDPARTVMFTTAAYAQPGGVQEYAFCAPPFWDFGSGPSGNRPSPTVHFRAGGKALVAWCDGRVTAEAKSERPAGSNPHGGDADAADLGWFGPDENNGYWNPRR